MAFANGAERRVALIAEATIGTTPTTPTFQTLRTITGSIQIRKPRVESRERRADRMLAQTYGGLAETMAALQCEWADDPGLDSLLESLFQSTFSADVMKNGQTVKSFTVETTDECGATDAFRRGRGLHVNSMSMSIVPGEAIVSTFNLIGLDGVQDTAIIAGATYTAAGTETVMCGTDFVLTDLFSLSSPVIQRLDLNFTNNMAGRYAINSSVSPFPFGVRSGSFRVTGSFTCYKQDNSVAAMILANTVADLQFTIGNTTNKKYTFDMLNVQVMDHNDDDGGNNTDITDTIQFSAMYDSGDAAACKITRNVA